MKSNTSKRLQELMRKRGLKQVDILELAKKNQENGVRISKTDLSQYVNGKVEPGQYKLHLLAKALDVSEAWLMGYDVPERYEAPKQNSKYVETIAAHIDDDVTEEEMKEIIDYIEYRKNKRK